MRISDWSSDVCSSDLFIARPFGGLSINGNVGLLWTKLDAPGVFVAGLPVDNQPLALTPKFTGKGGARYDFETSGLGTISPWVQFSYRTATHNRSEEHKSELPVTNAQLICSLLLETTKN